MQLIVLGMHRSGTSVLARLLNMMGAYFGPEGISTGANNENPKGFWERKDVRALNDFVLQSAGCDWNRVSNFDIEALPAEVIDEFMIRAGRIVLEMDAHRPWFVKEPRLCLLLALWRRVLDKPVCIHIHRSPVEVAASLQTRNQMPIEVGLLLWQRYVVSAHAAAEGLPAVSVAHRELMTAPMDVVSRLHRELGDLGVAELRLPSPSEVASFVNQKLYRERELREDLQAFQDAPQVALHRAVAEGRRPPARLTRFDPDARAVLDAYESGLPPVVTPQEKRRADAERKEQALARDRALDAMLPAVDGLKGAAEAQTGALQRIVAQTGVLEQILRAQAGTLEQVTIVLEAGRQKEAEQAARIETLVAENAELRNGLAARDREAATRSRDFASLREQFQAVSGEKAAGDRSLAERFQEIAKLTRMLEEAEHDHVRAVAKARDEINALEAQLASGQRQAGQLRERIESLRRQNDRLEAQTRVAREVVDRERATIGAMKTSWSWRLTRPVRWFTGRVRGGPREGGGDLVRDRELIRASGLFDDAWYLVANPDVREIGADPIEHYLVHGAAEGRDPSREFHTRFYLASHPDVAAAGFNPLVHYIQHGAAEGRETRPER